MSASNKQEKSTLFTFFFVIVLCFVCSAVLSILSIALKDQQKRAEEFNESRELLLAADLLDAKGHLFLEGGQEPVFAKDIASEAEVLRFYQKYVEAFLVNEEGQVFNFEELNLQKDEYLSKHKKKGFANLPLKLVYRIKNQRGELDCYVFPVQGFGLWDAIYGFLAMEKDGKTLRGVAWYEHKETPGLGAHITNPLWLKQFRGKSLFLDLGEGIEQAPLGLIVTKGKAKEQYQGAFLARAVDGIPGATLTGNGVMKAYKESMEPYRPFLESLAQSTKD